MSVNVGHDFSTKNPFNINTLVLEVMCLLLYKNIQCLAPVSNVMNSPSVDYLRKIISTTYV